MKFLDRNPHLDLNIVPVAHGLSLELPLHLGCHFTNEKIVERLLAAGANPESFCGYGRNALQCTAHMDRLDSDVVSWLTRGYEQSKREQYINSPDQSQGRRVTHYVARSPNETLEGIIDLTGTDWTLKDEKGMTPFEWAAKNGHWIIVSYIAMLQWFRVRERLTNDLNLRYCRWKQVNVQNVSGKSS